MRFDSGWVKLYRRCTAEDIGRNGHVLAVWVTLLCWAIRNPSKIRWKGSIRELPPGTIVIGIRDLADHLGFSKSTVYRAMEVLRLRDTIGIESGTRGTLVTIRNWSEYQDSSAESETLAGHTRDDDGTLAGHGRTLSGEVRKKNKKSCPFDLEAIYQGYPNKKGKSRGLEKLAREIKTPEDYESLKVAVGNYSREVSGTEPKFIKHFSTFAGVWRDYIPSAQEAASTVRLMSPEELEQFEARMKGGLASA